MCVNVFVLDYPLCARQQGYKSYFIFMHIIFHLCVCKCYAQVLICLNEMLRKSQFKLF